MQIQNNMDVIVVPYNPNWPKEFEQEAHEIRDILGPILLHCHHVGSTAVPGLMAKPIIDMMPEVSDLEFLDSKSAEFEALGYEVMGEYGIPGRRYFRKGGDNRTHHVHAFLSGDSNLERHLAFRDYLIAHESVAKAYGDLKFDIASRCNNDMDQYCDEKDEFVQTHEALAVEWYRKLK